MGLVVLKRTGFFREVNFRIDPPRAPCWIGGATFGTRAEWDRERWDSRCEWFYEPCPKPTSTTIADTPLPSLALVGAALAQVPIRDWILFQSGSSFLDGKPWCLLSWRVLFNNWYHSFSWSREIDFDHDISTPKGGGMAGITLAQTFWVLARVILGVGVFARSTDKN